MLMMLLLLQLLLLVLYYRKYRLLLLLALLMLLELPYQPNNQCNRIALTFIILNGATFLFLHWKKYPPFDHVESIFVSLNKYITVVCVNLNSKNSPIYHYKKVSIKCLYLLSNVF
jgi:hypothetical protein